LLDQRRADTDLDFKLHIRMRTGEPAQGQRQRTAGNFLDRAKAHGA